ncbi:MAG: Ty3/Gypsy family RNase HI domain-containing protein, partial [Cellvibrionaceae bacterium]|nr:Ty3/Gypsy family RNase HI domain-containing protein [Cellvibrionaceae bacterium]
VIAYASKKLSPTQRNYASTKGELFAGLLFMDTFSYYLKGRPFLWRTDNKALQWAHTAGNTSQVIQRWLISLSDYPFQVVHRAGTKHANADAMSRIGQPDPDEPPAKIPRITETIGAPSTRLDLADELPAPAVAAVSAKFPPLSPAAWLQYSSKDLLRHQTHDPALKLVRQWLTTKNIPA